MNVAPPDYLVSAIRGGTRVSASLVGQPDGDPLGCKTPITRKCSSHTRQQGGRGASMRPAGTLVCPREKACQEHVKKSPAER
jgi:hypothetical protein